MPRARGIVFEKVPPAMTGRTLKEAARRLGISMSSIRLLMRMGKLPHYKLGGSGGRTVFLEKDLVAYMEQHRVEARSE